MKRVFNSFLIVFMCVFGILGYRMQLEIMEMERPRLLTLAEAEEEILLLGQGLLTLTESAKEELIVHHLMPAGE